MRYTQSVEWQILYFQKPVQKTSYKIEESMQLLFVTLICIYSPKSGRSKII